MTSKEAYEHDHQPNETEAFNKWWYLRYGDLEAPYTPEEEERYYTHKHLALMGWNGALNHLGQLPVVMPGARFKPGDKVAIYKT